MSMEKSASRKDRAAFKAGERALGEVCEKLQEMVERSSEWIETVMMAAGFFLLAVAANAPKEMEVLGVKIDIEGEHRILFLGVLAAALLFRLVQGWALYSLSKDAIQTRFEEVVDALIQLRAMLVDRMMSHRRLVEDALETIVEQARLPYLAGLFDVSELLEGEDEQGCLRVFSVEPEQLRVEAGQLILRRRQALLSRGLAAWYPDHLWTPAAGRAVDLAVAEREAFAARQACVLVHGTGGGVAFAQDAAIDVADQHVRQLHGERDAAMAALAQHVERFREQAGEAASDEGKNLGGLVVRVDKINRTARRYRLLARLGLGFHLLVPTAAALVALAAVIAAHWGGHAG
ncbi:hypothetical protein ROSA5918_07640 [Roseateles saccharophilus]|uniref:Uncharacterized protein n=2 Tax=Roseateles saccharophilus TaxID=304 RepID=A0A4R3UZF1_ROSSA|nr:hypothetical protein EV671_101475 [Roseateles saccharophilus]